MLLRLLHWLGRVVAHDTGRPSQQVSSVGALLMDAELVPARWLERAKAGVLSWVLLGLSIVGFLGLMDCMVSNPNQRG